MNQFTYVLALLVRKDIITVSEAAALIKSSQEGVLNSNLGEMITKVDKALKKKPSDIEKVDASTIFNQ